MCDACGLRCAIVPHNTGRPTAGLLPAGTEIVVALLGKTQVVAYVRINYTILLLHSTLLYCTILHGLLPSGSELVVAMLSKTQVVPTLESTKLE